MALLWVHVILLGDFRIIHAVIRRLIIIVV